MSTGADTGFNAEDRRSLTRLEVQMENVGRLIEGLQSEIKYLSGDHEARLRVLEKRFWMWFGGLGVVLVALELLLTFVKR